MKIISKKEYKKLPSGYSGNVDNKPYMLYMDNKGRTVYGPVKIKR